MNIPAELKYTESHEWVRTEADGIDQRAAGGIAEHGQHRLLFGSRRADMARDERVACFKLGKAGAGHDLELSKSWRGQKQHKNLACVAFILSGNKGDGENQASIFLPYAAASSKPPRSPRLVGFSLNSHAS